MDVALAGVRRDAVEAVLKEHEIFYHKSEVWIEDEKMYEVLYEMTV